MIKVKKLKEILYIKAIKKFNISDIMIIKTII